MVIRKPALLVLYLVSLLFPEYLNNSHQKFKSRLKLCTKQSRTNKEFFRIQQDGLYFTH